MSFTFLERFEHRFVALTWLLCAIHHSRFGIVFHLGDITGTLRGSKLWPRRTSLSSPATTSETRGPTPLPPWRVRSKMPRLKGTIGPVPLWRDPGLVFEGPTPHGRWVGIVSTVGAGVSRKRFHSPALLSVVGFD